MTLPVGTIVTTSDKLRTHYAGKIGKVVLINNEEYGLCFGKGNKVSAWFLESELIPYQPNFKPSISFGKNA